MNRNIEFFTLIIIFIFMIPSCIKLKQSDDKGKNQDTLDHGIQKSINNDLTQITENYCCQLKSDYIKKQIESEYMYFNNETGISFRVIEHNRQKTIIPDGLFNKLVSSLPKDSEIIKINDQKSQRAGCFLESIGKDTDDFGFRTYTVYDKSYLFIEFGFPKMEQLDEVKKIWMSVTLCADK